MELTLNFLPQWLTPIVNTSPLASTNYGTWPSLQCHKEKERSLGDRPELSFYLNLLKCLQCWSSCLLWSVPLHISQGNWVSASPSSALPSTYMRIRAREQRPEYPLLITCFPTKKFLVDPVCSKWMLFFCFAGLPWYFMMSRWELLDGVKEGISNPCTQI